MDLVKEKYIEAYLEAWPYKIKDDYGYTVCVGKPDPYSAWDALQKRQWNYRVEARCLYCGCKVRADDVVCDRCGAPV